MIFVVTKKAEVTEYFDEYVVECEAMFGDADGYDTLIVGGFRITDIELLKDFVQVCERMKNAYPHGRGGYDDYNEELVEGYNRWFMVDNLTEEEYNNLPERQKWLSTDWLRDPSGFDGMDASFEDYDVFYYDRSGVKYEVEVVE